MISVDELFKKHYEDVKLAYMLWGKLVSSFDSPIIVGDNLKTTSVPFFVEELNLLCCEFDSFTFKLLYYVILY